MRLSLPSGLLHCVATLPFVAGGGRQQQHGHTSRGLGGWRALEVPCCAAGRVAGGRARAAIGRELAGRAAARTFDAVGRSLVCASGLLLTHCPCLAALLDHRRRPRAVRRAARRAAPSPRSAPPGGCAAVLAGCKCACWGACGGSGGLLGVWGCVLRLGWAGGCLKGVLPISPCQHACTPASAQPQERPSGLCGADGGPGGDWEQHLAGLGVEGSESRMVMAAVRQPAGARRQRCTADRPGCSLAAASQPVLAPLVPRTPLHLAGRRGARVRPAAQQARQGGGG